MKAKLQNWLTKVNAQLGALLDVVNPTVAQMTDMKNLIELKEMLMNEIGK